MTRRIMSFGRIGRITSAITKEDHKIADASMFNVSVYDAPRTPVYNLFTMECDFHMPWVLIVDNNETVFGRIISKRDSVAADSTIIH